jgi:PIN domain nuclease of toxin-antitoxin system
MRLLLDTHAFLWFVGGHARLSARARSLISDPGNEALLSMGVYWEIAIKVSRNKLTLAGPFEDFIDRAILDNNLSILPITVRHASALIGLHFHHRDPFDRLLVAQAMVEGVPLVSFDSALDPYPITRLW